jgi:hypothetical protein
MSVCNKHDRCCRRKRIKGVVQLKSEEECIMKVLCRGERTVCSDWIEWKKKDGKVGVRGGE